MKKIIFIALIIALAIVATLEIVNYFNRDKFEMQEGQISQSPEGNYAVYVISDNTDDFTYCKIFLFDTSVYPDLKVEGKFPSKMQMNNPRASYYMPVVYYARSVSFEWNESDNYVDINQGSINGNDALTYEIDLQNFSLKKKSTASANF
jgi:hypothetical protein